MTAQTDDLIARLAENATPVKPLASPLSRAFVTLGGFALVAGLVIWLLSDPRVLEAQSDGALLLIVAQLGAMLVTGALAVIGAFQLSIPGRPRGWLIAPLPSFALWLLLSGIGCYRDLIGRGEAGSAMDHDMNCLLFILAASAIIGPPVAWRLSRAAPIDPLPVAALGGLGIAALSAFLLHFFHPFTVTFLDLAVHLAAILLVVGAVTLFNRRMVGAA